MNFGLNPRDLSILQYTFVYSIVFPVSGHQHSQPGCVKFNQSLFFLFFVQNGAKWFPWRSTQEYHERLYAKACKRVGRRRRRQRLGIQDLGHGHGSTSGPQVPRSPGVPWHGL